MRRGEDWEKILLALVVPSDLVLLWDLSQPCFPSLRLSKEAVVDTCLLSFNLMLQKKVSWFDTVKLKNVFIQVGTLLLEGLRSMFLLHG